MNDQFATAAPAENPAARPGPPPLRVHHLFAVAGVAAVSLMIWRNHVPADVIDQVPLAAVAANAVLVVLSAAGLTLAGFSIYWRMKGYASLSQPGQWLVVGDAMFALPVVKLFSPLLRTPDALRKDFLRWDAAEYLDVFVYFVAAAVYYLLPVIFFAWCAWRVADTRAWRVLFALIALSSAIPTGMVLMLTGAPLAPPFTAYRLDMLIRVLFKLAAGVWAWTSDHWQALPRAWTHWTGLALFVIPDAIIALGFVAQWLGLL